MQKNPSWNSSRFSWSETEIRRITMGLIFRKTARKINRLHGMIVDIPAILPQSPIPDFLTLSNRGFYPVVVSDCVYSMDKEAHERSLKNLENLVHHFRNTVTYFYIYHYSLNAITVRRLFVVRTLASLCTLLIMRGIPIDNLSNHLLI